VLKRLIRSELETALAREMLGGSIGGRSRQRTLGRQGRTRGVRTQRATADWPSRSSRMSRRRPRRRTATLAKARARRIGERRIVMGVFEHAYRILDINRAVLERCARTAGAGNARRKRYPSIDSRTCSELKTVVGAIQSKPRLCSVRHQFVGIVQGEPICCIDSVGPLPGTG
jgi:hypothetical protein